ATIASRRRSRDSSVLTEDGIALAAECEPCRELSSDFFRFIRNFRDAARAAANPPPPVGNERTSSGYLAAAIGERHPAGGRRIPPGVILRRRLLCTPLKGISMMSQVATEHVLAVPTEVFHRLPHLH